MKLTRFNGTLMLVLQPDVSVSFQESWVDQLKVLPYEQFGEFIKKNIYPAFSDSDRSVWNRSQISNQDIQSAIADFLQNQG